jgi:hypothetical protein
LQHDDIEIPTASLLNGCERLAIEVVRLALADLHATCERSRATANRFLPSRQGIDPSGCGQQSCRSTSSPPSCGDCARWMPDCGRAD